LFERVENKMFEAFALIVNEIMTVDVWKELSGYDLMNIVRNKLFSFRLSLLE